NGDGGIFDGHAINFAVEGDAVERGRRKAYLVVVFGHGWRQVRYLPGLHVLAQRSAAPGRKNARRIPGADGHFDFGLVRIVVDGNDLDLNSGSVLLDPVDGLLDQFGPVSSGLMMPNRDGLSCGSIGGRRRSTTLKQKDESCG